MTDPDRKSKIISIRLSEAEYEAFRKLYRSHGARNVSDFARQAMQRAASVGPEYPLAEKLQELDGRLEAVEALINEAFGKKL